MKLKSCGCSAQKRWLKFELSFLHSATEHVLNFFDKLFRMKHDHVQKYCHLAMSTLESFTTEKILPTFFSGTNTENATALTLSKKLVIKGSW